MVGRVGYIYVCVHLFAMAVLTRDGTNKKQWASLISPEAQFGLTVERVSFSRLRGGSKK